MSNWINNEAEALIKKEIVNDHDLFFYLIIYPLSKFTHCILLEGDKIRKIVRKNEEIH